MLDNNVRSRQPPTDFTRRPSVQRRTLASCRTAGTSGQPTAREDSSLIIRSGKSSIFSTHPYVGHVYCKLSLLSVLRVNHFVAYLIFCISALFAVTLWNILCPVITAQRSYASAVLGVVILSDRPSVCPSVGHTRALWLIQRTYRRYFIPHERAILLVFSSNSGWCAMSPST